MGVHLGFDAPSSLVVAFAMGYAVLAKKYTSTSLFKSRSAYSLYLVG